MDVNTLIFILTQDSTVPSRTYYHYHTITRPRINTKLLKKLESLDLKSLDVQLFIKDREAYKELKQYQYEILRRSLVSLKLNIPAKEYGILWESEITDFFPKMDKILKSKGRKTADFDSNYMHKHSSRHNAINEQNVVDSLKNMLQIVDMKGMYKLYETEKESGELSRELDLERKVIIKANRKIKEKSFKEKTKEL